jgi:methionine-rich copper-binding protein CopC
MRVGVAIAFALSLAPNVAFGHAILREASVGPGRSVRAETPTSVTLRFNSGIETRLSKVTLVAADGNERVLDVRPGDAPGQVTVELPPLAAGSYGLRYRVLAADGHMTDSLLRFSVTTAE